MNTKKTITIGIPTCYSGDSLIHAVQTIREGNDPQNVIIIEADRTPLTEEQSIRLKNLNVEYHWNEIEDSQFKKLNQIIAKTSSDTFVFTQDDITFNIETIDHIRRAFESDDDLTVVGVRIDPLPPKTFAETGVATMVKAVGRLSELWNDGDNYLSASGRCMAFKTSHLKKFRMPKTIVNGDAYLYFENIRLGGKFKFLKDTFVSIRCPSTVKEQLKPSSRFQYSKDELQQYFEFNLDKYYKIPNTNTLQVALKTILNHPLGSISYGIIFIYTRLLKLKRSVAIKTSWDPEFSTKETLSKK